SRPQYVKDQRVWPKLRALGWDVVRAIKEDRDHDIVRQAWDAMVARGWRPRCDPAEIAFPQKKFE
ncbi:MAG TPA: hypothetical protein VHI10_11645, partial [Mycobacterium sp.]|nr:hypothetical protein [Mycobacterium sp.]